MHAPTPVKTIPLSLHFIRIVDIRVPSSLLRWNDLIPSLLLSLI
jgi:hypothetical protein